LEAADADGEAQARVPAHRDLKTMILSRQPQFHAQGAR
jgi:hypothetical protein